MKNRILIFFFIIITTTYYSQTTFFIKYRDSIPVSDIKDIIANKNIALKSKDVLNKRPNLTITYFAKGLGEKISELSRIIKVHTDLSLSDEDLKNIQQNSPGIEYIQKAHNYKIDFVPNDEFLSQQWALGKIQAFDSWNITEGSDSIVVGLIDTGIDYLHPDLKKNIYINSSEDINKNGILDAGDIDGIDEDGNGFIDDVIGWDFTDRQGFPFDTTAGDYLNWDNNPNDENGHGTNVAGIIAAESNNRIGIAGAAPNIRILNIRAFDPTGNGEEDDVAAAILYAVKMKAKVINMSFGDDSFSMILKDVVKYAYTQNLVLVGSSGNSSSDLPHYPSSYSEVISVGASTKEDYIASFSNTGSTIDLVAPGVDIFTTSLKDSYSNVSGTSAAAPFVSAASALILSLKNFYPEEVKQILKSTSDDLPPEGWDLQSGAGRLNINNALSVIAPSIVKINYPNQDYATNKDTLNISATILSPYFLRYELDYGSGFNPQTWHTLLNDQKNQFVNKIIYSLNLKNLADTVYTLRLLVQMNNGGSTEERVNFYIDHTPPKVTLISLSPAYYGDKSTILAQLVTDDITTVKMYYRIKGSDNFNFISLDGFTTNNEFVKKLHFGFIPKDLIFSNTDYEIFIEAINLSGLATILKDSTNYFFIKTDSYFNLTAEYEQSFSLPPGLIFKNPVNFTNSNYKEIILQELNNSIYPTKIYKYENDVLVKIDSMTNRYPKDFGDFNSNGKWDLLSSLNRTGFIDEQIDKGSTKLANKWTDSSGAFFPILAADIDKDNKIEILSIMKEKTLAIWQVNTDLTLSLEDTLNNFSQVDSLNEFSNIFAYTNAAITDCNNDGKNEIWIVDQDGDIMSYNINEANNYSDGFLISTDFSSNNSLITAGDYDGDGKGDVAVLLQSSENYSIAPFNLLLIFNLLGNKFNILYEKIFIDPSAEYKSTFQSAESSIRLADIDNDGKDEIILFTFPYSYIIKNSDGENKIISYKENINSNSIFIGDLNSNGIKEIGYPAGSGIKFIEFAVPDKPDRPTDITGYSPDSVSIFISWEGSAPKYYIYKGNNQTNFQLIDSTDLLNYIDKTVLNHHTYYYQLVAFDPVRTVKYSDPGKLVSVYVHEPAKPLFAECKSENSFIVNFSDRISTTIENLLGFEIPGKGFPNSITPSSQYSYLVSYNKSLAGNNELIVKGLKDFYNSPIKTDTLYFSFSAPQAVQEFYINSFEILSQNKIKIIFNLDIDRSSAGNAANYSFDPQNSVTNIGFDENDNKSLNLTLRYPVGSIGKAYRLKVENVFSSPATGGVAINEESGSYLILSSYAQNLDNVYVYPNPAKLNGQNFKITFANLTKNATINIFSLNGKKIKTLIENNGDGGVDWDLKNEAGQIIGSGIYIFRVAVVDDQNNESQVKLGKFAVLK